MEDKKTYDLLVQLVKVLSKMEFDLSRIAAALDASNARDQEPHPGRNRS